MPAQPCRKDLENLINLLAEQYDAPVFEPHVTLFGGTYPSEDAAKCALLETVRSCPPLTLQVERLDESDLFIKTVFVQLHASECLTAMSASLRDHTSAPSAFVLNPHLSLIYKHLRLSQRQHIAGAIRLPLQAISFDAVQAVAVPKKTAQREDVECWQTLFTSQLAD